MHEYDLSEKKAVAYQEMFYTFSQLSSLQKNLNQEAMLNLQQYREKVDQWQMKEKEQWVSLSHLQASLLEEMMASYLI